MNNAANINIKKLKINTGENKVNLYWYYHTVNDDYFFTKWESHNYFKWLINEYPLVDKLMTYYKDRKMRLFWIMAAGQAMTYIDSL